MSHKYDSSTTCSLYCCYFSLFAHFLFNFSSKSSSWLKGRLFISLRNTRYYVIVPSLYRVIICKLQRKKTTNQFRKMEDTVKKARNYAWKCFAVLSVGAVIHLIVSFHHELWFVIFPSTTATLIFRRIQKIARNISSRWQHFVVYLPLITSSWPVVQQDWLKLSFQHSHSSFQTYNLFIWMIT